MPPIDIGSYRWLELFGHHVGLTVQPLVFPPDRAAAEALAESSRIVQYHSSAPDAPHTLAALIARALCSQPSHRAPFAAALLERAGFGSPRWREVVIDRFEVQQVSSAAGSGKTAVLMHFIDAFHRRNKP